MKWTFYWMDGLTAWSDSTLIVNVKPNLCARYTVQ